MKRPSSSSSLARAVLLLAIIVCCFLLPCSDARAKGATFNSPSGMRSGRVWPYSPIPGPRRTKSHQGSGHAYAVPPPAGTAIVAPAPPKQQNCSGCGNAYAPLPPPSTTTLSAPGPPNQPNCPGCGYADALAPHAATTLAPKQHHCSGCGHAYAAGHAEPERENFPGTRY
ncbi:hypothetical protein ZWY2020_031233 [Hordeum vulgare]|nr:hypothetical protein ZWY2020_031233 [Hordeum vulgare]